MKNHAKRRNRKKKHNKLTRERTKTRMGEYEIYREAALINAKKSNATLKPNAKLPVAAT